MTDLPIGINAQYSEPLITAPSSFERVRAVCRAKWLPSENAILAFSFLTVLAAVGLQIARAFGATLGLPDVAIDTLADADSLLAVIALGVRYESETSRIRSESTEEQQRGRIRAVRRESVAYGAACLAVLASIGLALASNLGIKAPGLYEASLALGTAGTLTGMAGLGLEYTRTRREEIDAAENVSTVPNHNWTYIRAGISLTVCLLSLVKIGLLFANLGTESASMTDLRVSILTGSLALINLTSLAIAILAQRAAERRRLPFTLEMGDAFDVPTPHEI
jgi:hypothetical protein